MLEPTFSIIFPVYNRPRYLPKAIESVISQTYTNWELIIADDNSNLETKEVLNKYTHPQVHIISNPENLGLFPNLNKTIGKCKNNFILLLCSDDFLLVDGLEKLANRVKLNSETEFFLTAFEMTDGEDNSIISGSQVHYQSFLDQSEQILSTNYSLPLLLKLGSINGNLTGMCFSQNLVKKIGGFRETWKHAADWEWVYRACTAGSVNISTNAIACIRQHQAQLSGTNFKNISNSLEVIEMVDMLLNDPVIHANPQSHKWALHILQYHLWFALKFAKQGKWREAQEIFQAIGKVMPISEVTWQMLKWLPIRWQKYTNQIEFPLPPD